ncbi:NAD(P)/FAD-dependent oxidoreductase [Actinokineospora sp. HUAS TT18]|uniref:NAD(P)/FAD-dependent oxidoreductase n=1 Tax=Actinokineospora sp. HUAS TT18 TaxID=3447451 RepID=UPI003F52352A
MDHYDAVIVGARPAGAATGMLLARAGLRVLIVDRSRRGADTLSTHALMRGGVLQLRRWGLLDEIIAAGTPPVRHATFHTESGSTTVPIKSAHGVDALYAPRRTVLDPVIADAAAAAGATVRYGVTAKALRRDDHGRVVGIVGHDQRGPIEVQARFTIGADGMGSRVAHWAGAVPEHLGTAVGTATYGYWDTESSGYQWFFRHGTAAGAIPTNDGQTCVFVATTQSRFRRELVHDPATGFRRLLPPELADRLPGTPPLRRFPGRRAHLRQASGPGWALVGDAGYFKDPITAHGLTDALRDAELLAHAIVTDTLPDYQATRDRLSLPLFTATDAIAGYAWDEEEVTTLLKQLSAAMAEEVDAILAVRD